MSKEDRAWLHEAVRTLGLTQEELSNLVHSSLRTVQRLYAGRAYLTQEQYGRLARAVYPRDADLAARIASSVGTTLEALGVEPPRAPPPQAPPPLAVAPPPAPPPPPSPHAADSVLCAAADLMNLSPQSVRPIVSAVFHRARDLGLSVEAVIAALGASEPTAPAERTPAAQDDQPLRA